MSAIKEQLHEQIEEGQRGLHKIGWLNMPGYRPETWNPVVGCTKVSPGCENCYAEVMAYRLERISCKSDGEKLGQYLGTVDFKGKWTGKTYFAHDQFEKLTTWKTPRMIFVCSMSDLFHESTSFENINAVFSVMADCDQHIFIVLTKRPERIHDFLQWKYSTLMRTPWMPSKNVWIGVTAENQEQANKRIPLLLSVPAAKRFVSVEPMLGPIVFSNMDAEMAGHKDMYFIDALTGKHDDMGRPCKPVNKLDWVICGGETGPKARPMNPEWVRSVRDQCKDANVPFFFKGWGKYYTHWADMTNKKSCFKMYESYQQFTQKLWVKKGDVLVDMDGKHCKNGGDMMTARYPVAIMNPMSVRTDLLDGKRYQEWPKVDK